MANVRLEHVTKVYPGGVVAVRDATFEVRDREFVVLVGPSGCGKSTILRMIAGLEEITEGDIYIDERRVNDVLPKDRDIAMVFQNYALYPHMTVYKNMAFGLKLRKTPKEEIDRRVREAADILGIAHLLDRKPRALSGGERQRVAVGRAIVRHPKVFLFDEPLSNLDAKLRVQMRAEISKLHSRLQATMIYVTHDQVEAMTMGDRIVVLNQGVIQQIDTPLRLYDRPRNMFVAGFIGNPPMNFLRGELITEENRRYFLAQDVRIALPAELQERLAQHPNGPIVLGIRPEHVQPDAEALAANPLSRLRTVVDVVEPLGDEVILYLSVGDQTLIAKIPPETLPRVGEPLEVALLSEKLHVFDPETEENLTL
ncbi:MAG: sugar ABC transporter ATP-binding protein [Candidatus Poribacteria bacterium]|nr:MAG: sugar ABC transporter ATP-binding protein [Candidatus Poribacteria bacterium]